LVDGSQFAPTMKATLKETFATLNGYPTLIARWFREMFTTKSKPAVGAAVVERAGRLPRAIGEKMLLDMVCYDTDRLPTSLRSLRVPVMAIQTTYSNKQRERRSMGAGQNTPYLEMLRANVPAIRIEIIPDTGHFPQFDEPDQTNALIDDFIATLPAG
jgi:pimeloyl-ACP methyl ester carboxylesterase